MPSRHTTTSIDPSQQHVLTQNSLHPSQTIVVDQYNPVSMVALSLQLAPPLLTSNIVVEPFSTMPPLSSFFVCNQMSLSTMDTILAKNQFNARLSSVVLPLSTITQTLVFLPALSYVIHFWRPIKLTPFWCGCRPSELSC